MAVLETATVVCTGCAVVVHVSTRSVGRMRAEGRDPLCAMCRRPRPVLTAREREDYQRWWRARFSDAELVALAAGIWR